jgi:hypothetical protein
MIHTKVVEKIKTRVMCSIFFENLAVFLDNVEKYCIAGQATDDNMAHGHCRLDA